MPILEVVRTSNAQYAPSYIPTAVFIGGTSGIGRAMAEAFAQQTKGRANVILIARKKEAANEIIASFPSAPSPDIKHEFISCDAKEMKNVHVACEELNTRLSKINFLVLSVGGVFFRRHLTDEGNELGMAQRYYCRAKFITELLPLLSRAKELGEDARVLSILGAGTGSPVDISDPGLQNWSIGRAMTTSGSYNDIMVKVLSEKHPQITFIHATPGFVDTPGARLNWLFSLLITIFKFLGLAVTAPVSAQFHLYPILSPDFAKGNFLMDNHAETLGFPANLSDDVCTKIWEHTLEVIKTE